MNRGRRDTVGSAPDYNCHHRAEEPVLEPSTQDVFEQIDLVENDSRLKSMQDAHDLVRRNVGKSNERLILRMHPETHASWYPNITGATKPLSNRAQEKLDYRCNLAQPRNTLAVSYQLLAGDTLCRHG
jgi:hypothetical protein